jgi:hypothetical protein
MSLLVFSFKFKGRKEDESDIKNYISRNLIKYFNDSGNLYIRTEILEKSSCERIHPQYNVMAFLFDCIYYIEWEV